MKLNVMQIYVDGTTTPLKVYFEDHMGKEAIDDEQDTDSKTQITFLHNNLNQKRFAHTNI